MTRVIRTVLACVLCASSGVIWGDSIEQTFQFDCDVPAGRMSDWIGTIVPQLQQVAGTIELLEPREHERWWPVASVFLIHANQKVGLQLYRDREAQDTLQVAVLRHESEGGRSVLTSVPWKGSPVAFLLSVDASGVKVSAAGKVAFLDLKDVAFERIALSCSTAQFKFTDVVVRSQLTQQSVTAGRPEAAAPAER
jgi:hypothetical protein